MSLTKNRLLDCVKLCCQRVSTCGNMGYETTGSEVLG